MGTLTSATLEGMWAGLPVPWTIQDEIDEAALRENVRRCCRVGVHGVYTHGTTGEFYAQTPEEWSRVVTATIEEARPFGTPVQIGCTSLWTREAIRRAATAQRAGASAIQLAFPFWLALTDDQAVRFLREVTDSIPGVPLVIYNTQRSKKPLTAELLKRIIDADIPVIGCKGAQSRDDLKTLGQVAPQIRFFVREADLADWWECGARGSYSSLVYACPQLMLRYYAACKQGDPEAREIQKSLKRMDAEFTLPRANRGLYDTAFDRTFATATGFLTGSLLISRAPYDSATEKDAQEFRGWCAKSWPEFMTAPRNR
ncbi:MAG: dihydrodipicolinate synthase family protein [Terriglobia bacterium]|jgi:dihydrodipicolinate synthase/N-acetylneuraminate lyase